MKLNKLPVFAVLATLWFAACSDENNAVANLEGYATSPEELISGNEIPTNDIPDTQNPGAVSETVYRYFLPAVHSGAVGPGGGAGLRLL